MNVDERALKPSHLILSDTDILFVTTTNKMHRKDSSEYFKPSQSNSYLVPALLNNVITAKHNYL